MAKSIFAELFKQAASCKSALHNKTRKGRRPIRVTTLLKKSSQSGADLRLPVMGGTKFPTNDSLSYSKALLKEHQNVARPKMERPTLKSVVPQYKQTSMPKVGAAMNISEDPLVQYLQKEAAESSPPPTPSKPSAGGELEDNLSEMELGEAEQELSTATPDSNDQAGERNKQWKGYFQNVFKNTSGVTQKNLEKEKPYSAGVVNKALGIK